MPEPELFAKGFGIVKNTKISHFTINNYSINETPIKRYSSYKYDVSITFSSDDVITKESLQTLYGFNHLENNINSSHGNAYACTLDYIKEEKIDDHSVIFYYIGHAERIY